MGHQKPNFIFSQNLRRLMEERRVRLSHLSHETEIPKSTVHDWMHGGNPRDVMALKRIADYFSMSIDEICFGELAPESQEIRSEAFEPESKDGINIGSFDVILLRRQK